MQNTTYLITVSSPNMSHQFIILAPSAGDAFRKLIAERPDQNLIGLNIVIVIIDDFLEV